MSNASVYIQVGWSPDVREPPGSRDRVQTSVLPGRWDVRRGNHVWVSLPILICYCYVLFGEIYFHRELIKQCMLYMHQNMLTERRILCINHHTSSRYVGLLHPASSGTTPLPKLHGNVFGILESKPFSSLFFRVKSPSFQPLGFGETYLSLRLGWISCQPACKLILFTSMKLA